MIAILAAITIVTFSGIQQRAKNVDRLSDIDVITQALELYKIEKGTYPTSSLSAPVNGCSGGGGFSYSWATDNSWLAILISDGYLKEGLKDPVNNCTNYYRYNRFTNGVSTYGCPSANYYLLQVLSPEAGTAPSNSTLTMPAGCTSWPANYVSIPNSQWSFTKFE